MKGGHSPETIYPPENYNPGPAGIICDFRDSDALADLVNAPLSWNVDFRKRRNRVRGQPWRRLVISHLRVTPHCMGVSLNGDIPKTPQNEHF